MNGRNPLRLAPGFTLRPALGDANERELLLGGVNDLYPPLFPFRAAPNPPFEFRELLLGGVKLRYPFRLPFCAVDPAKPRVPGFISRPLRGVTPAVGLLLNPLNPPREFANPVFVARPPAVNPRTWFCAIACCRCDCSCWNDAGRAMLLCVPKKRSEPPLRIVDGAAARPLADKLARDGTTGRLPAICRAPLICERVAATAVTRPAPNRLAPTVDIARMM